MDTARVTRWRELANDRRVVDAALVLGCVLLNVLATKTPWSPLPRPVIAVIGVAGSGAQWWRRAHPHAAALAGAGAFALSGNPGPWLVGLYAGGSYAPRKQVWLDAVAAWAGYLGWAWIANGGITPGDAVFGALGVGLVAAVGVNAATRNALVAALRERSQQIEAERLLRDEHARAAERTRIAREMHDVLAHKVSLIALHAGALELHARGHDRLRRGAALIRATARDALAELRDVLGVLRVEPEPGSPGAVPAAPDGDLASLVRACRDAGQPVELRDEVGPLPPATARVAYRVAQEGLTNARKHAPDAPTTVAVRRTADGGVMVTVRNESGTSAPVHLPGSGSGLVGLAERVRLVGGRLRSGPLGGGWELSAVVPWLDRRVEESAEVDAP